MSDVIPFAFEGHPVRIIDRAGEPWFVLADVCRVLEIANSRDAANRLDEDEKDVAQADTLGGRQNVMIINESGMYRLVMRSDKPAARRFQKWVTSEVLPTIRKTGGYGRPAAPSIEHLMSNPEALLQLAAHHAAARLEAEQRAVALADKVEVMRPAVRAFERIDGSQGSLCIRDAAKTLKVKPKDLTERLINAKWIYRRPGCTTPVGYQDKIAAGLVEHVAHTIELEDGGEKTVSQLRITAKGLAKLAKHASQGDLF